MSFPKISGTKNPGPKRVLIAAVGAATLVSGAAAWSAASSAAERDDAFRPRGYGLMRMFTAEDRQAFADARIAALHAGLKLNADQEKLWPPVEDAIRNLARVRREQRAARRGRPPREMLSSDVPGALRAMADAGAARADALRKLADASAPLYAMLDEGQKRRALVLGRPMHRHMAGGPGMMGRGMEGRGPMGERGDGPMRPRGE